MIIAPDGDAIAAGGGSWTTQRASCPPLTIEEGRAPTAAGEVAIDVPDLRGRGVPPR